MNVIPQVDKEGKEIHFPFQSIFNQLRFSLLNSNYLIRSTQHKESHVTCYDADNYLSQLIGNSRSLLKRGNLSFGVCKIGQQKLQWHLIPGKW